MRICTFTHIDGKRCAIDVEEIEAITERSGFVNGKDQTFVEIETSGTKALVSDSFDTCLAIWRTVQYQQEAAG